MVRTGSTKATSSINTNKYHHGSSLRLQVPSKLATLQNPLTINPQTTPNPIENYINKLEVLPIITLKKEWIGETPIKTTETIIPLEFHYTPIDINKTHTFYTFILVDTDFGEVSNTPDNNRHIVY